MPQISRIHTNIMGTASFDGKFEGMRKAQEFVVYPMKSAARVIKIQSDTRIGTIDLVSGGIHITRSIPGGAYGPHLAGAVPAGRLTAEELFHLKAHIMATASGKAGTNGMVYVDNSGAIDVFTQGAAQ